MQRDTKEALAEVVGNWGKGLIRQGDQHAREKGVRGLAKCRRLQPSSADPCDGHHHRRVEIGKNRDDRERANGAGRIGQTLIVKCVRAFQVAVCSAMKSTS